MSGAALSPPTAAADSARLRGAPDSVPRYNGGCGYIHGPHDRLGRTTDATAFWSKRRSPAGTPKPGTAKP